jgi:hypothetical protein
MTHNERRDISNLYDEANESLRKLMRKLTSVREKYRNKDDEDSWFPLHVRAKDISSIMSLLESQRMSALYEGSIPVSS